MVFLLIVAMVTVHAIGAALGITNVAPPLDGAIVTSFSTLPAPECLTLPLANGYQEWSRVALGSSVRVEWAFGNETCSSMDSCFGIQSPDGEITALEPQITPLQIQKGVKLRFFASPNMDQSFHIHPYRVSEEDFRSCEFARGQPLLDNATSEEFEVRYEFLRPGPNYFIADASDPLYQCKYGLRVNITVRRAACVGPGETATCWNHGRCVARTMQPAYSCTCCHGYTGDFCDDVDACISSPCHAGATCIDVSRDVSGKRYRCSCPLGYYGSDCSKQVDNLCTVSPCANQATCIGNSTDFICHCRHGYSGDHCEVNVNECDPSPCGHGVCVDGLGGYQCFCLPGYGGTNCDQQYNECQSNPCRNTGFCMDRRDGYECHCSLGYSGPVCGAKVDLCNPSPCQNATECVDFGHRWGCTCNPGYTGEHCEVNVNECESNPCQHGGKCYDHVAGYKCICTNGVTGDHCEYAQRALPRHHEPGVYEAPIHSGRIHNLYIVASTLGGALLLAAAVLLGCYCRVHETWRHLDWRRGYTKHQDSSPQTAKRVVDLNAISRPGPLPAAIMDAAGGRHGAHSDSAPLVSSLRPKRV